MNSAECSWVALDTFLQNFVRNHMQTKSAEKKLTYLALWYAQVCVRVRIRGYEMLVFWKILFTH